MALITVAELKKQFQLENVDIGDISDEDLTLLLNNAIAEVMGYTNAPINPKNSKIIIRGFESDMLELDYYPISSITSVQIGSKTLTSDDYILDDNLGILYFNSIMSGLLVVEYVYQVSDDTITNFINPLLSDILKYKFINGFKTDGVMSSVKEGDVSVNYDTSTSLGNLIYSRMNDLKSKYSIRIKVL